MQMEVNHENKGQKTQDAHFSLQLDSEGMLGTRAFLRKGIKDDIQVKLLSSFVSFDIHIKNQITIVSFAKKCA